MISGLVSGAFAGLHVVLGASGYLLDRPDLLGLVFTFKMLCGRSQGEGSQAAGCSVLCWALSLAPGLRLGWRWDPCRMLPSHWLLTRTAPAGRALPASPLVLAGFLVLYFDSKSKAASPPPASVAGLPSL